MKVLLNGATSGSNFGDYLFALVFQKYLEEKLSINNVYWYQSKYAYSQFFSSRLDNKKKYRINEIDALIYIPGGYFCGNDRSIRDFVRRYFSYIKIGIQCIHHRIPYAIIGLEVGKSKSRIIQLLIKKVLKSAKVISVRNNESQKCLVDMGITNSILTADAVFAIPDSMLLNKSQVIIPVYNKKKLLFHIHPDIEKNSMIESKLVPIVNKFISDHPEYMVVVCCDQYSPNQKQALNHTKKIIQGDVAIFEYDNPLELCQLIFEADFIITTKLHVGIVGAKFSKPVISFSGHTDKISRLYSQLGESNRSYSLAELTVEQGVKMVECYYDKPIIVDKSIFKAAQINFELTDSFLKSIV